jgi:hypothetical protein
LAPELEFELTVELEMDSMEKLAAELRPVVYNSVPRNIHLELERTLQYKVVGGLLRYSHRRLDTTARFPPEPLVAGLRPVVCNSCPCNIHLELERTLQYKAVGGLLRYSHRRLDTTALYQHCLLEPKQR